MECDASDEREPQVSQEVVDQVLRRVAPAKPAEGDRDDADGGGLRSAEENHCEDEREEASGDLDATRRLDRAQIAQRREAEKREEERGIPVADAPHQKSKQCSATEPQKLGSHEESALACSQGKSSRFGPVRVSIGREFGSLEGFYEGVSGHAAKERGRCHS